MDPDEMNEWLQNYFSNQRASAWNRFCEHDGPCSCAIWDRNMRDIRTYSGGKLRLIRYVNKINIGGCNACSAIDGRAHYFDRDTGWDDCFLVSCDCLFRDTPRPEGCTCPEDGQAVWPYAGLWEEE